MCIICVEFAKGLMTPREAIRNLGEMVGPGTDEETIDHIKQATQDMADKAIEQMHAEEDLT